MSKNKEISNQKIEARIEGVEHAFTRAERFIETYRKQIVRTVGFILGVAVLYIAFQRYYLEKWSAEAAEQMFPAEQAFADENWTLALDGDGNNPGFIEIIDNFSYTFTASAKLAKYYAGICFLRLGNYEDAIAYLSKFRSKDAILSSTALGSIGDAFAETGDVDQAVVFYKKAANRRKNDFTTPLYLVRAGILLEQQKKFREAAELYNLVRKDYPNSTEGRNIVKYLTRVEMEQQQQ
ncbi:MAG: tetratricopeptide repeat protein [Bacteroidales bacterium]|jgi:tetratricopeptide (TPR) repeat protein|nr:tetratricopeptide repeat protein [Bacteroidales bacterium]